MTWLESRPPSESVIALGPASVLAVPYRSLEGKVSGDLGFAKRLHWALARELAERLRRLNVRIALHEDADSSSERFGDESGVWTGGRSVRCV